MFSGTKQPRQMSRVNLMLRCSPPCPPPKKVGVLKLNHTFLIFVCVHTSCGYNDLVGESNKKRDRESKFGTRNNKFRTHPCSKNN